MTDVQAFMWMIILMEFFIMGMWFGGSMAQRDNPNEPKPKNWDGKLRKEWEKGFKSGEKSMMKRMSSKLKDEELVAEYNSRFRKGE
jgi:hypothetical protein